MDNQIQRSEVNNSSYTKQANNTKSVITTRISTRTQNVPQKSSCQDEEPKVCEILREKLKDEFNNSYCRTISMENTTCKKSCGSCEEIGNQDAEDPEKTLPGKFKSSIVKGR